jgi:hypothetical protein
MKRALLAFIGLALGAAADPCAGQQLGRLFFTPEQRATLDERRKARVPDKPAAAVVASPTTRLDGYVQRSGGRSTFWVQGESLPEDTPGSPRIDPARNTVSVPVSEAGARVRLKPGEVLDRGTGQVHDVIGDGEIKVRRGEK